jgi:hypothetical protein
LSRIDEYSFDESHKENQSHYDFRSDNDDDNIFSNNQVASSLSNNSAGSSSIKLAKGKVGI